MNASNIRKIIVSLAAVAAFAITASAQGASPAGGALGSAVGTPTSNGPYPSKVGVINFQVAVFSTNEGKRDLDALTKKFEPLQLKLKALNDEVETDKKQFQAQQDKLSEEERAKRVRDIDAKQKSLQRQLDDAQNDYQAQVQDLGGRIATKMNDVLLKYAAANNLAMILDVSGQQQPVLWASEQVNIGPAIVDAYNTASGVPAPPVSAPSAVKPGAAARPAPSTTTPAKKPAAPATPPKQ